MKRYRIPVPADFAEVAPTMTQRALAQRYGVDKATVAKWSAATGAGSIGTFFRLPDGVEEMVRSGARCTDLMARYGVSQSTISRWLAKAGLQIEAEPLVRQPVARRYVAPVKKSAPKREVSAPAHDGSLAARAAEYLRRRDPVFRCTEAGVVNSKGSHWYTCSRVLTGGELVERAKAKGWDPDAWKQLGRAA